MLLSKSSLNDSSIVSRTSEEDVNVEIASDWD
jgi:hypothetical protein